MKRFQLVLVFILIIPLSGYSQNLYDTKVIQDIRIEFKNPQWRYLLDSMKLAGDDKRVHAIVTVNGTRFEGAGVRYRGSSSYIEGGAKNPFNIKLDYLDSAAHFQGYRSLKLSNLTDDPTYVREVLGYQIARKFFPAPGANFAKVYINGQFEGLYVNIESINKDFLDRHFDVSKTGEAKGFYKCTPYTDLNVRPEGCLKGKYAALVYEGKAAKCYEGIYEDKSGAGYKPLAELMRVLDEEPENIEQILDVERTLWMHAFNNVLVNLSSYSGKFSHNYYLFQQEDGRFVPIIWDLNLAFGTFKSTGEGLAPNVDQLAELEPRLHAKNPDKPLISALLKNPRYVKLYQAYLRTILREYFRNQKYLSEARIIQSLIRPILVQDENTYYSFDQFSRSLDETILPETAAIPGLASFMTQRTNFLRRHDDLTVVYPRVEIRKIESESLPPNGMNMEYKMQIRIRNRPSSAEFYYRIKGEETYTKLAILDDGIQDDKRAGNGVFGVSFQVQAGDIIQYYIKAFNDDAVRFEPQTYLMEPLEIQATP